ncbi:TPA: hypothetical protein N0F65_003074 [Lagenidium giganteum]|uniref:Uncharacterized protein n=1 Tax=Lagenidium giganteum TaxID=4803 RepID=A0AAV2YQH9_9STRA|nr:TPA: hypothetical protein N0F65_003074 [Lagenidium giganteum]
MAAYLVLALALEVVQEHVERVRLLTEVGDDSARGRHNLAGLAQVVDLAETAPLAELLARWHEDEVHAVLLAQGAHELAVAWLVAVLGQAAEAGTTRVEGLGGLMETTLEAIVGAVRWYGSMDQVVINRAVSLDDEEKQFSVRSGKEPWEPDMHHLDELSRSWTSSTPTLNELIREDIDAARHFFRSVLQVHYPREMRMWNKWGVMEWKAGNVDLARMIFSKASKLSFHPELWQSWASMEREAKNYREAKRLYKVVLATDPTNADAGLGLALLEAETGDKETAREMFAKLHEEHPDDHLILHAYGVFEAKCQNMPMARRVFSIATNHEHATAQVWHAWGQAEYNYGFYKNALSVTKRAMSLYPTHKWIVQLHAMTLYKLGDVMEARRSFRRLVDYGQHIEPSSYNAYAKMEEEIGNEDAAMGLYVEVLGMYPDHLPSIMSLALLHRRKGHMKNARRVFETAMKRAKTTGPLLCAWGQFEELYGEADNARELYDEATKETPNNVDAWRGLARMESQLGDITAARAVLTMATQHITNDVPLLVQLAKIEQANRNLKGARKALEQALVIDNTNAAVWNMRALVELPRSPQRTQTLVESALNVIPKYEKTSWSILMCTYGRAFAAQGEFNKAVAAFEKSFALAPKNWETHVIFAETVLAPNEAWEEAKRHLQAARNICRGDVKKLETITKKLTALKLQQSASEQQQQPRRKSKKDAARATQEES